MMRVAILAPIANSLYSRLVAHLAAAEPDIELVSIVARTPWNLGRIRGEFQRDGARLIHKVRTKLVIGEDAAGQDSPESIGAFAQRVGLDSESLGAFAAKRHIPFVQAADHNAPAVLEALREAAPDVIAFTGGGLIRNPLLAIPRLGILNCHCGLLPLYRGMDVVEWPAAEGRLDDPGIGLTLHFMDSGLDTGPILLRKQVELRKGDTFESIRRRVPEMQVNMILEGLRGLRDGLIEAQPQEASAGRQYFVMHPRIRSYAVGRLRESLELS